MPGWRRLLNQAPRSSESSDRCEASDGRKGKAIGHEQADHGSAPRESPPPRMQCCCATSVPVSMNFYAGRPSSGQRLSQWRPVDEQDFARTCGQLAAGRLRLGGENAEGESAENRLLSRHGALLGADCVGDSRRWPADHRPRRPRRTTGGSLARRVEGVATAAVVKGDGYGIGLEPAALALAEAGCHTFFVALPEEGQRLRAAVRDAAIYVLDGLIEGEAETYAASGPPAGSRLAGPRSRNGPPSRSKAARPGRRSISTPA